MKEPSNLSPDLARNLLALRKKAAELPNAIHDDEEKTRIAAMQSAVHVLVKNIEAWYKRHTDPIAEALSKLRAEKKAVLGEPEAWLSRAESLLADYFIRREREAERERVALQKKLDREAAAARKKEISSLRSEGDRDAAAALASAPIIAPVAEVKNTAAIEGKSFRDDLDITILDLGAVPDEYITRTLRVADVKRAWKNGVREIPGLQLRETKILVNRA